MHGFLSGIEFMFRGGFMMYPLLLSALVALTVILERLYLFHYRFQTSKEVVTQTLENLRKGDTAAAEKICAAQQTPVASVLLAGVRSFAHPTALMELAMKNQAERWVPILEKRIDVIDTVITAAPLMGLLGTITGMMASFQVLSEKGVNEPNAITGGVAEALIATATGLVIALFCLVAYNYLNSRVKDSIFELESVGSQLNELKMALDSKKHADKHA
jgi:biopolymer transport protein ExbB